MLKQIAQSPKVFALFSLLAGLLLPFGFAPYQLPYLSIITPALLLILMLSSNRKQSTLYGYLFGCGLATTGAYWIYTCVRVFGNLPSIAAFAVTVLFALTVALFYGLLAYLFQTLKTKHQTINALLVFPLAWTFCEVLRAHLILGGFPWLLLAHAQVDTVFSGFLPIMGEIGTSFLACVCAGLIALLLTDKRHISRILLVTSLILTLLLGHQLAKIEWSEPTGSVMFSSIQANITQDIKWDEQRIHENFNHYLALSKTHIEQTELLIWPESAITVPIPYAENNLNKLKQLAHKNNIAFVTGIPIQTEYEMQYYNAAIGLGKASGTSYKQHLVPFGEIIPFARALRPLLSFVNLPLSMFTTTTSPSAYIETDTYKMLPIICFDVAYSDLYAKHAQEADFIITLSDDSWYGNSSAQAQHLQIARMRAKQVARQTIFTTNDGITALVNQHGRVESKLPSKEVGVLHGQIIKGKSSSPWTKVGDTFFIVGLLFSMVLLALTKIRLKKNS